MITAIEIENFKAFGERQRIELRPITLLFGPNSAGKSSLIHAIHYAYEIMERRNVDPDQTLLGGEFIDLGGFQRLVHQRDLTRPVRLKFEFEPESQLPRIPIPGGSHPTLEAQIAFASVEFEIRWNSLQGKAAVSQYTVEIDGAPLASIRFHSDQSTAEICNLNFSHPIFEWESSRYDLNAGDLEETRARAGDEVDSVNVIQFLIQELGSSATKDLLIPLPGLRDAVPAWDEPLPVITVGPADLATESQSDMLAPILDLRSILTHLLVSPGQLLRDRLRKLCYIGPLRNRPARNFVPPRHPDPARWADGMAAWDKLFSATPEFLEQVSNWLAEANRLGTGYGLRRREVRELDSHGVLINLLTSGRAFDDIEDTREELEKLTKRVSLSLVEDSTGLELDPQDVGVGIAQVLPVVVAVLSDHANIVAIEQPELHIHPRIQVALGDLMIDRATRQRRSLGNLLVETHSEHLLLRLLRRIRETSDGELPSGASELRPMQLSVIYIEPHQDGVTTRPLRIDETGEFIDRWPKGFFEERVNEL